MSVGSFLISIVKPSFMTLYDHLQRAIFTKSEKHKQKLQQELLVETSILNEVRNHSIQNRRHKETLPLYGSHYYLTVKYIGKRTCNVHLSFFVA